MPWGLKCLPCLHQRKCKGGREGAPHDQNNTTHTHLINGACKRVWPAIGPVRSVKSPEGPAPSSRATLSIHSPLTATN